MSELTITLRGAAADKLRKLVAEERYAHAEAAVEDALDALDASRDAALDTWLRETVATRAAAHRADPERAMTPEEVRKHIFGQR